MAKCSADLLLNDWSELDENLLCRVLEYVRNHNVSEASATRDEARSWLNCALVCKHWFRSSCLVPITASVFLSKVHDQQYRWLTTTSIPIKALRLMSANFSANEHLAYGLLRCQQLQRVSGPKLEEIVNVPLEGLPAVFQHFTKLTHISGYGLPPVGTLPTTLTSLKLLRPSLCNHTKRFDGTVIQHLPNLTVLHLEHYRELANLHCLSTRLQQLYIHGDEFKDKVDINYLPANLNLQKLSIAADAVTVGPTLLTHGALEVCIRAFQLAFASAVGLPYLAEQLEVGTVETLQLQYVQAASQDGNLACSPTEISGYLQQYHGRALSCTLEPSDDWIDKKVVIRRQRSALHLQFEACVGDSVLDWLQGGERVELLQLSAWEPRAQEILTAPAFIAASGQTLRCLEHPQLQCSDMLPNYPGLERLVISGNADPQNFPRSLRVLHLHAAVDAANQQLDEAGHETDDIFNLQQFVFMAVSSPCMTPGFDVAVLQELTNLQELLLSGYRSLDLTCLPESVKSLTLANNPACLPKNVIFPVERPLLLDTLHCSNIDHRFSAESMLVVNVQHVCSVTQSLVVEAGQVMLLMNDKGLDAFFDMLDDSPLQRITIRGREIWLLWMNTNDTAVYDEHDLHSYVESHDNWECMWKQWDIELTKRGASVPASE